LPAGTTPKGKANNYIAEWFGHRVYPVVAETEASLKDQYDQRCPFLTEATGKDTVCVKKGESKGVCTINSTSNGEPQDWLACPIRALDQSMLHDAAHRLFGSSEPGELDIVAAPVLANKQAADKLRANVGDGKPTVVYFQNKLGGEIKISSTDRSPEFSFDSTMIEILPGEGQCHVG